MSERKGKNILFINGIFEGHITGVIEIIKDLVSLGYSITCYILDSFADRFKKTGAKLIIYHIDKSDIRLPPKAPAIAINMYLMYKAYEQILSEGIKSNEKYDFLIVDRFFDGRELNKIFKANTVITIFTCVFVSKDSPKSGINEDIYIQQRIDCFKPLDEKYNLNIRDFKSLPFIADSQYKFVLTSKYFNPDNYALTDNSFYFLGPSIENREIDNTFNFKKDENKKLIYISLGTIFYKQIDFYKKCIKIFGNNKEYQIIISVGKTINIKEFGDLPDNVYIYNYVPQIQVLDYTDIFITHGGTNSVYEALILKNLPLIVIPIMGDQFSIAEIIEKNEAGISLNIENITSEILLNSVNELLKNKEKYKIGIKKILESFKEARNGRKKIYEELFK